MQEEVVFNPVSRVSVRHKGWLFYDMSLKNLKNHCPCLNKTLNISLKTKSIPQSNSARISCSEVTYLLLPAHQERKRTKKSAHTGCDARRSHLNRLHNLVVPSLMFHSINSGRNVRVFGFATPHLGVPDEFRQLTRLNPTE